MKKKRCHPDIHSESKAALTLGLYNELENLIANYRNSNGTNPPCRMGCASCCSDLFSISHIEFELMLKYVKENWDDQQIEELYDKSIQMSNILKIKDSSYYRILKQGGSFNNELYNKQIFYGTRRYFPCVFLDQNTQACKVYNIRPFVCRSHGTTHDSNFLTADQEVCEYIQSDVQNSLITPDSGDISKRTNEVFHAFKENKVIRIREYPIFYWFVIYYEKTGKKDGTLLEELKHFKVTKRIMDNELFNSIQD